MLIGINSNLVRAGGNVFSQLAEDYYSVIIQVGGIPIILPCIKNAKIIPSFLEMIDGLVISGAGDLHPVSYGEKSLPQTKPVHKDKQWFDLRLAQLAWRKRIPTLAICYGVQLLNVALGGTLFQDIRKQLSLRSHRNSTHYVYIAEGSLIYRIIKKPVIQTNSFHHQAIKQTGKHLRINAKSEDGLIEGIEATDPKRFFIGVQWHLERMKNNHEMKQLFRALVDRAKAYRKFKP